MLEAAALAAVRRVVSILSGMAADDDGSTSAVSGSKLAIDVADDAVTAVNAGAAGAVGVGADCEGVACAATVDSAPAGRPSTTHAPTTPAPAAATRATTNASTLAPERPGGGA